MPSSGPNNSGTQSGSGWQSATGTSNNSYQTTSTLGIGATSSTITWKNFGFSIPAGATITGIQVTVATPSPSTSGFTPTNGSSLGLTAGGTAKTQSSFYQNSVLTGTYGGSSDLWGATLSPSTVNSSTFGVNATVTNGQSSATEMYCGPITVTVYYTNPTAPSNPPTVDPFGITNSMNIFPKLNQILVH